MSDKINDPASSEQADVASSITVEQVNQIVNSAISSRFKSFERKLDEFATNFKPTTQEEPKKEDKFSVLQRQMEAIQKERDAEVAKRKDTELRTSIKDALVKSGVSPHMVKAAMSVLVDSDKVVGYNDDDQIVFKTATGDLDLANGIKTWAKSEEGKVFVAPRGTQGSGERSFGKPTVNGKTPVPSSDEVGSLLGDFLLGASQK